MKNINFDDGYKEFTINNDPDRTIRFNPSDVAIVERLHKASDALEKLISENTEADAAEAIERMDATIREQVDYIFNQPVSNKVFGNQSPMAPVGGKMLFERFLEAATPVIMSHVKAERKASEKRISKYVSEAQKL